MCARTHSSHRQGSDIQDWGVEETNRCSSDKYCPSNTKKREAKTSIFMLEHRTVRLEWKGQRLAMNGVKGIWVSPTTINKLPLALAVAGNCCY